jgi:peptidylprolyl isomerase
MRILCSCFFCMIAAAVSATPDQAKMSEALGHMIGKNLQSLDVPLDIAAIAKGLQDEAAGLSSPMTEDACVKVLMKLQEEKKRKEATVFLDANKKREGVTVLEGGKLQYEILKKGDGQRVLSYNSPLVRLKSEADNADSMDEILALDEAILGLKLGITGMREGEIRKLYIHPDLAHQKQNELDPQNSLLIFEVEILEADASSDAHAASNSDSLPIFRNLDDVHPLKR